MAHPRVLEWQSQMDEEAEYMENYADILAEDAVLYY